MRHQSRICGKLKKKKDIVTDLEHVQNLSPNLVHLPILDHGDGIVQDPGLTAREGVLALDVGHLLEEEVPLAECLLHLDTKEAEVQLDAGDVPRHLCLEVVVHHPPLALRHHLQRSNPREFPLAHHASHAAHLHLLVLHGDDTGSLRLQALHRKGVPLHHSNHHIQESQEDLFHLLMLLFQNTKL